ncbi:MAG: hypothetical protein FJZ64_00565, partial [Chlamydiae bacterium]|nr:hypothetical protein [Chlamydiota bacterium]
MIFLELNEFNPELLRESAEKLRLKNIQRLVSMYQTQTHTDDTYESDFLEPWVQWVSVHTGTPSSTHQIKHLGDVPHLATPQLWETLTDQKISSGIWGAMNASRREAKECRFFLPDPWTAEERAYPEELNQLLEPLRFVSKNYLNLSSSMSKRAKGLLALFLKHRLGFQIMKKIPALIFQLIQFRGAHFVFISFFEFLSTLLFLKYRERYNPDVSLLFINTIAHLQHHHWHLGDMRQNGPLSLGMR